ncbi:hypothetical protein [Hymenobacter terricola]|uniref:hypothetical protein n=1 Tax=Hymenobacter terricola TaxID=2819236 RepID=UPI001B3027E2|nr:hypothetical protein [Hymenobacter terricola]
MSASTELEKLSKQVAKRSGSTMELHKIQELLTLDEEAYQRDSPRSIGKTLRVVSIAFSGVKNTGEVIEYARTMADGVNLWVADNSKRVLCLSRGLNLGLAATGRNKMDKRCWAKRARLT